MHHSVFLTFPIYTAVANINLLVSGVSDLVFENRNKGGVLETGCKDQQ